MNIIEIIQSKYSYLTNKQKAVAKYLINKPSDICYISLAALSKKIGCSEVTILKFCKNIGVNSFIELKEEFRNYNQSLVNKHSFSSYSVPAEIKDTDSKIDYLRNICSEELDKITNFYNSVDLESVLSIAKLILKKHIIYLFAHDASKVLATFLKVRLEVLNLNVVLVDLSDMKEVEYIMTQVSVDDVCIFLSFPNYYYSIKSVAENIKHSGCDIVLITDSLSCPVADCTDNVLTCNTRTKIFYNSWLLPIALMNILTSNLAMLIEDSGGF